MVHEIVRGRCVGPNRLIGKDKRRCPTSRRHTRHLSGLHQRHTQTEKQGHLVTILRRISVDLSKRLPLSYWQCIQSLTNLHSTVMHEMRLIVAALTSMTKRSHIAQSMHATAASARFAMEIWRAVVAVAIRNPDSIFCMLPRRLSV